MRLPNGLDPDLDRRYVRPDLATNYSQRLSADDKSASSREKVDTYPNILTIPFYSISGCVKGSDWLALSVNPDLS